MRHKTSGTAGPLAAAAAILCASIFLAACPVDTSSWYPSGKAAIVSFYEYSTLGEKTCVATVEIANTGKSSINSYTVSVSAATDAQTYYKTVSNDFVILPGRLVYLNVEIGYLSEAEALQESGLAIMDEFYR